MKKGTLILNVILLLAVAILFYLHFTSTKTSVIEKNSDASVETNSSNLNEGDTLLKFMDLDSNISAKPIKIAYVNNDSLTKNLTMLKDVEARIGAKTNEIKSKIKNKQRAFENDYNRKVASYKSAESSYMLKAPNLSDAEIQKEKEKLTKLQKDIITIEQTVQQKMYEYSQIQDQELMLVKAKEMEEYYLKVQEFCKSFAKTLGFDFILIYQNGGQMLYANPTYDISTYVVNAINKEYTQTNKK